MQGFSDIDPDRSEPWLSVPKDWRRPVAEQRYELLWDRARSFGQVWPRPSPEEVIGFYDLAAYYTHRTAAGPGDAATRV